MQEDIRVLSNYIHRTLYGPAFYISLCKKGYAAIVIFLMLKRTVTDQTDKISWVLKQEKSEISSVAMTALGHRADLGQTQDTKQRTLRIQGTIKQNESLFVVIYIQCTF